MLLFVCYRCLLCFCSLLFHSALWRLECERSTYACTHKSAYVNHNNNNNSIKVRTNLNRKCVRVEGEPRALAFHSCTSKLKVEITLINRSSISGLMNLFHISNYATILQLRNAKVLQFLNDHLDIPKYTYLQIFMLNVFFPSLAECEKSVCIHKTARLWSKYIEHLFDSTNNHEQVFE